MLQQYVDKISSNWKSLLIFYFSLCLSFYLGIWSLAGPLDIPKTFETIPNIFTQRIFWLVLFSLFLAAHCTLIIELFFRKNISSLIVRDLIAKKQSNNFVFIIAANTSGIKVMSEIMKYGYQIKGVYDKNSNASGLEYARSKSLAVYSNDSSELRKMLSLCSQNKQLNYYIFLTTDYPQFVTNVDAIIRSIRKNSTNFRYYRIGIDFDVNVTKTDLARLIK